MANRNFTRIPFGCAVRHKLQQAKHAALKNLQSATDWLAEGSNLARTIGALFILAAALAVWTIKADPRHPFKPVLVSLEVAHV